MLTGPPPWLASSTPKPSAMARDLHPLGRTAGAAVVGLDHVGAFLQQKIHEGVLVVFVFAGGDAHVERRRQFRIAFVIVRRQRLFIPEAAQLLIDAARAAALPRD